MNPYENTLKFLEELRKRRGSFVEPTESLTPGTSQTGGSSSGIDIKAMAENAKNQTALLEKIKDNPQWLADTLMKKIIDGAMGELPQFPNQTGPSGPPIESAKTPAEFAFANTFVDKFLKPDKSDVQKGLIGTAPLKKPEETLPAMNKELVKTYPLKTPIEQEEKEDAKSIIDEALSQLPGYTSSGKAPPMESAKTPAEFMFANSAADRFLNPTKEGVQKSITGVGSPEDAAAQFVDRTVGGSAASRGAQGFVSGMFLGLIPMVQKKFVTEEFESELKKLGYENVDAVYKEMMATPAAQVGSLAGSLGAFSWVGGLAKAAVSTTGKLFGLKTLTDAGQATQVAKVLERVFRGAMFFGGQEAGRGGDVGDVSRAAVRGTVFVAGGGALSDLVGTFGTAALTRSPLLRNSLAAEVVLNTLKGVTYGAGGTALTIPLYGEEGYEEGRPDASDIINTGITIGLFSFLTATIGSFKLSAFHKQKLAADANNISRQAGDLYGQAREAELKGDAATAERYYRDILALLQSFGKTIDTNRYLGQQKGVNELKNVLSDIDALIKVDIANLTPRGGPTPQLGSGTAALPGGGLTPQLGAGPTNVTMSSPGVVDMTDSSGAIINRIDLKTADKGTLTSLMNLPAFKASTLSPETHAVKKAVTQALLNAEQSEQKEQEILQRADEIMKQSQTKTLQDQLLQNRQKEVDTQVQKRAEDIMKTSQRTQPVTNQQKTVDALRTRAIQGEDVQKELSVETQKLLQLQTAQTIDIQREVVNTLQQQLIENPMDTKLQSSLVSAMDRLNKLEAEAVVPKVPTEAEAVVPKVPTETKPVTPVKPVEKKVALPTALKDIPLAPKATDTILQVFSPGNVPEKDMQKYKTLVDQQALLIWEAIDALSAKGYIIPERISLGVTKEIEPRILDLDKMKKIDVSTPLLKIEALTRNNEELARLFRDAGLSGYADIIDEGTALFEMVNSVTHEELLSGQTPISKDLPIYKAVDTVKKALGEADVNNIYHTSNERFIRLPDTAIVERSTGRGQMVASEKPLTKKQMDEWELIPVIQQDLSKVPDKKPETKTSTTPVAPVAPVKKAPVKKAPVTEASVKKIYEEISKKNFDGATEGFAVSLKEIMKQGNFDQKAFVKFIEDMQKNPSTSFELGTARDQSLALDINGQKRSSITFYEKPKVPQEPIKLFHGSNQEITTNLKVSKAQAGKGIFLADKIENAKEYGKFIYEIEILPTKIATDKEWRSTTEELDREYEQKRNELEQALEKGSISEDVYESKLAALLEEWTSGETMDLEQNAIISDRLAGKGFDVYQGDMQSGYPGKEFIVLNPNIITKVTLVRPEKPKVPPIPVEPVKPQDKADTVLNKVFKLRSGKDKITKVSVIPGTGRAAFMDSLGYFVIFAPERNIDILNANYNNIKNLKNEESASLEEAYQKALDTEKKINDTPVSMASSSEGKPLDLLIFNVDNKEIGFNRKFVAPFENQELDFFIADHMKGAPALVIKQEGVPQAYILPYRTEGFSYSNLSPLKDFWQKTTIEKEPLPPPAKKRTQIDPVIKRVFKPEKEEIRVIQIIPGTDKAFFSDGHRGIFADADNIQLFPAEYPTSSFPKAEQKLGALGETLYKQSQGLTEPINNTAKVFIESDAKPPRIFYETDKGTFAFNKTFVQPFHDKGLGFYLTNTDSPAPMLHIKNGDQPVAVIIGLTSKKNLPPSGTPQPHYWKKIGDGSGLSDAARIKRYYQDIITKHKVPPPAAKMGAAALKDLARKEDAVNKLLEGKNVVYSGNIPYAVKGKGFVDTFLKNGTVDIVGSKVSSAHDLAMISQVYRDPRFETFRYVFIGEDSSGNETILMTSAVSARLPRIASVLPIVGGKSSRAYREALFIAAEKRGATGFYLLHNHPTGKVSPSDADASATKTVVTRAEAISNLSFRGHVVINGTEYALMHDSFSQGGKRDLVTDIHPLNVKSDNILVPEIENPLLGQQISGSSVLAQFAAQAKKTLSDPNNISLIFADTKLYIKGVLETTKGTLDDDKSLQRFLFEQGLSLGSPRPFLIINSFSDPKIKKTLTKMIQRGYLEDVYGYEESTSFRDVFPNIRVVETNPWEDMETHGTTQSLSLGGTHPDDEKKLKQELASILLGKDVKDLTKEENNIIQEEMHGYSTGDGEYRYSKNPIPERGKERERGYSDTMGKSDTIHPDIRARFRSDPLLYKMMQNKDVFSEAERRFDSITDFNAAYDAFLKQRTSWDPADVPFAEMLANHFALKGDMSRADGIIVALADNLTYHGRMIQAVNIMQASKSPTVALRNLQKQIDRINEEGRIRFPKKWKDLFLTPEEKAALTAAFGPTGINKEEWDRILQQIYERMNMERPRSMMEYINSWRKFAMLSSPKTQIRNILGNVMMMGMSNLRDINGFFLERMFVRNPYDRRYALGWKLFADGKRRFEIANKAWDDYMDTLIGVDKYMLTGLTSLQIKGQRTFKTPWLHEITSLPMKGIRGMDIPFMKSAFVRALGMELSAKNVFDYDEQMLYNAGQRALEDTFKQVNIVTTMLSDVVRKGGIPGFLVDINIPFLRAPINIVKNAFEYNPTGFISSTMSAFFGKSKGDTKKIIDNYAKALSGTQIALLGFLGVLLGFIRGSGRNTTQQQRIVRDLAGQQPWSIQTSYGSYTVDWMQPFAGPFLLGAEFAEFITAKVDYDIKNYKDLADAAEYIDLAGLVEAMFSSTDAIFNMGTMRGVRNMLGGSYGSVSQAIAELPLTFLEQSWPTVFGQVARTVDPVRRQTRTGNFVSDWWRTMQARIPGASLALPEQLDVFGRVVYQGKVSSAPADTKYKWTNAINQVLSPGNFMGLPTDPVDIEVVRLYNSTRESSALPRYAPKRVTYNNVEYELTPDDQTRFQIIMGGELYAMLREDFSSSGYREATDEMRVRAVSQRVYAAYERAKADLIQRRNLR